MAKHEVRGPDPDGDWFVVAIEGDGNERQLDEAYGTEAAAQKALAALD